MNRLRLAVRAVRTAAMDESSAFTAAAHSCDPANVATLRAAHLTELDAIQQLIACMEVVERRHPDLFPAAQTAFVE